MRQDFVAATGYGMELTMAIADWIRDATERRRQRLRDEGRRQGLIEGIRQGRREAEAYNMGYDDRDQGKPRRWPPIDRTNSNGDGDNGAPR